MTSTLHKWFFLATTVAGPVQNLTAFITVEVPEGARDVYTDAVVEKLLKSVAFRKPPVDEQLARLPFRAERSRRLSCASGGSMPASVVLSDKAEGVPFSQAFVDRHGRDRAAPRPTRPTAPRFAQDLINSGPVRDLAITLRGDDAGQGHARQRGPGEQAENIKRTNRLSIVQWLRFSGNGFLRVVGVGSKAKWDPLFSRFRARARRHRNPLSVRLELDRAAHARR